MAPPARRDILMTLLSRSVVSISAGGEPLGTGFFLAPDHIVTCAHVVAAAEDRDIDINLDNETVSGRVLTVVPAASDNHGGGLYPFPDVAVIHAPGMRSVSAWLTPELPALDDRLHCVGYTRTFPGPRSTAEPVTFTYEGLHETPDGQLLKLASGSFVVPGMSGAPLLNLRTGRVCGILKVSRDPGGPHGGWGIPIGNLPAELATWLRRNAAHHTDGEQWVRAVDSWAPAVRQRAGQPPAPGIAAPPAPPTLIGSLPSKVAEFRGRDADIARIAAAINQQRLAGRPAVVVGPAGIGKTSLVREYAHRYADLHSIVWWIDGTTRANLIRGIQTGLRSLGLDLDTDELSPLTRTMADALAGSPAWLVVLDNVRDDPLIYTLYAELALARRGGAVALTSRSRIWSSLHTETLEVAELSLTEAAAWLGTANPAAEPDAATIELARKVTGYPLAVTQTVSYMRRHRLDPARLLTVLGQLSAAYLSSDNPPDYPQVMQTTLQLSLTSAARESEAAVLLLAVVAVAATDRLHTTVAHNSVLAAGHPAEEFERAMVALNANSLVAVNGDTMSSHQLIREFTVGALSFRQRLIAVHTSLRGIAHFLRETDLDTDSDARELVHGNIQALIEARAATLRTPAQPSDADTPSDENLVSSIDREILDALHQLSYAYLQGRGVLRAVGVLRNAVDFADTLADAPNDTLLRILRDLAGHLMNAGRSDEGYDYAQRRLHLARTTRNQREEAAAELMLARLGTDLPGDDWRVHLSNAKRLAVATDGHDSLLHAEVLAQEGKAIFQRGQLEAAKELLTYTISIIHRVAGYRETALIEPYRILGLGHAKAGAETHALRYLGEALSVATNQAGADDLIVGLIWSNIGDVYIRAHEWREAARALKKCTEIYQLRLGIGDGRLFHSFANLGLAQAKTDQFDAAVLTFTRAHEIVLANGGAHDRQALVLALLGLAAHQADNRTEAAAAVERLQSLDGRKILDASADNDVHEALDALVTGLPSDLLPLGSPLGRLATEVRIRRADHQPATLHERVTVRLNALTQFHRDLPRFTQLLDEARHLLDAADDTPETAVDRAILHDRYAVVAMMEGDQEAMLGHFRRALNIYRATEHYSEYATAATNLAQQLIRIDRTAEAADILTQAVPVVADDPDPDGWKGLARVLTTLAEIESDTGDPQTARAHLTEARELHEQHLEVGSIFFAALLARLAAVEEQLGDPSRVVMLRQEALRAYGVDLQNPEQSVTTIDSHEEIAKLLAMVATSRHESVPFSLAQRMINAALSLFDTGGTSERLNAVMVRSMWVIRLRDEGRPAEGRALLERSRVMLNELKATRDRDPDWPADHAYRVQISIATRMTEGVAEAPESALGDYVTDFRKLWTDLHGEDALTLMQAAHNLARELFQRGDAANSVAVAELGVSLVHPEQADAYTLTLGAHTLNILGSQLANRDEATAQLRNALSWLHRAGDLGADVTADVALVQNNLRVLADLDNG